MNKSEFLEALRVRLAGEIPAEEVAGNIEYYKQYIEEQMRNGKTQQVVLQTLGDPNMIARTIIDTTVNDSAYHQEIHPEQETGRGQKPNSFRQYQLKPWIIVAAVIGVVCILLSLVFTILRVLLPIILPIIIIFLVLSFLKGRR